MLSFVCLHLLRRVPASAILLFLAAGIAAAQVTGVPARSVPLALPSAIAYDTAGNLYIAESQAHSIRKVDTSGSSTRFAGDGTEGFSGDGGRALSAQLDSPQGLAVDAAGNVYISDSGNGRVRRVDAATGSIATVAGSGSRGFSGDGGPPGAAALNLPRGLCVDATGTQIFIADSRNQRIRRVDLAAGKIETYAGSGVQGSTGDGGPAIAAALDSPESIALDTSGNLLIADTHNGRIRRVDAGTHLISTLVGADAKFARPRGVALDAQGNLYVADAAKQRVLRLDHATGAVSTVVGGGPQGFAGDGGIALAAALDSPRAVTVSADGLLTIADSANGRVRQLLSSPAADTPIQTIAGLGVTVPGVLTLTAASVEAYGSASVAANLRTDVHASGQVTFLDVTGGSGIALGTAALAGNTATLSVPALPAGTYRIMATYAGDAMHGAAQTPVASLTIAPLPLVATPNPATAVYGTAPPVLGGTLSGLLPQDASRVSVAFASAANATSDAGTYPISATLAGPAAANYALQISPAAVAVTQANSSVVLRNGSPDGSFTGLLQVQASSSTSGAPTGLVALLDGGTLVQRAPLSAGAVIFSATGLGTGTHVLTASYVGDRNFLPSSSAPLTATVAAPVSPDFSIAATGPASQTLTAGGSVTYALALQLTGSALNSPIQLAVTGLPAFTSASFSPSYIPPGSTGAAAAVLTVISTSSATASTKALGQSWPTLALALPLPLLSLLAGRKRSAGTRSPFRLALVLLFGILAPLVGCGDRVFPNTQGPGSPTTYTLHVTGTATGSTGATLQHTATVTLQMIPAQ